MTNAAATPAARGKTLRAALGLNERLFSTARERELVAEVERGLDAVERRLFSELSFGDELADATSRYLLDAGGKRVRPALVLLVAQLGLGNTPSVIAAAAAIELTHVASLYHDDVMDEAPLRRGTPSVHEVWGNAVAVLSGDLMFARASSIVASLGERALQLQASTFERLCLGQLRETVGPRPGEDAVQHYLGVLRDKTGSLIALAAQMGVVFSEAPREYEAAVVEYGERIGVAFQLIDDVIDLSAEAQRTGKQAGTDISAGVPTLPLLKLRARADEGDADAASLLERIEAARELAAADPVDPTGAGQFRQVVAELRAHAVTAETVAEAHDWASNAVAALEPLPEGPVRKGLTRFAEQIVERDS